MASTSAREIGFAAAAPAGVDVPADADGPTTPSPAVVSSSGEFVVDLRLADQEDGYGAGGGHAGDEEEHRTVADEVGKATRKGRRDDIAAVVERFVSPRAACHGRPADQAQTQGCHGRWEDRRGRPDRCLRRDDHHEHRHQIEHDATPRRPPRQQARRPRAST